MNRRSAPCEQRNARAPQDNAPQAYPRPDALAFPNSPRDPLTARKVVRRAPPASTSGRQAPAALRTGSRKDILETAAREAMEQELAPAALPRSKETASLSSWAGQRAIQPRPDFLATAKCAG